ncbi:MAG TPA: hypothetical protein V6D25_30935 [Leptolyngbyaceae cyanobacterium]
MIVILTTDGSSSNSPEPQLPENLEPVEGFSLTDFEGGDYSAIDPDEDIDTDELLNSLTEDGEEFNAETL